MTALDPQHDDLVRQHRFAWDCFVRTREDRELSKFFYSLKNSEVQTKGDRRTSGAWLTILQLIPQDRRQWS